ncbi:MAG: hypothetical protein OK455_05670 [Thaumarchaeota archaeon]|nr:hypothetical protein [Nitrososphaerota archaeon]
MRELRLQEVDNRLDELALVESFIERLDGQILDIASRDPKAKLLDTLPGLAPYTALYLACVLDDIDASPTRSTLAPTWGSSRGLTRARTRHISGTSRRRETNG